MSRRLRTLLGALAAAQVASAYVPARRQPAVTRAIVVGMLGVSFAEAWEARGRRGVAAVAAAGATGFAAELAGVATGRPFGHYGYSPRLGPQIRGVPLLAAAAWAMMARPSWVVARGSVPGAAAALTAWDVFLDPRMVRDGYWHWDAGGRYEGIPASNFAGWWLTGLGVFAVVRAIDPEPAEGDGALVLYLWTWVGESVANAVVWRRPRVLAAGTAAMGAFAVPALRRRL